MLLAACLCTGSVVFTSEEADTAYAQDIVEIEGESEGFTYEINDDGTVCITSIPYGEKHLDIPATLDGKKVVGIEREYTDHFKIKYHTTMTSISIPDRVTSIGKRAFEGCSGLTSITIPMVKEILAGDIFKDCNELKDIYYKGSEAQWAAIAYKLDLSGVTVHCMNTGDDQGDTGNKPNSGGNQGGTGDKPIPPL